MTDEEIEDAGAQIGYSAVKYFDLKNHRSRDYKFNYDAMLSTDGDTAVCVIIFFLFFSFLFLISSKRFQSHFFISCHLMSPIIYMYLAAQHKDI